MGDSESQWISESINQGIAEPIDLGNNELAHQGINTPVRKE